MHPFYQTHSPLLVSVDCIIFGINRRKVSVLLSRRRFEPCKGMWSLMGGFVGRDESLDDAAARVLRELTGLEDVYMEQVGAFGEVGRDPGERVISVAYYAMINFDDSDRERVKAVDAQWVELDQLPPLGFDHQAMINKALKQIRSRLRHDLIITRLLPTHFTLTQLQEVYEDILGEAVDKRNFRKRIAEMGCFEKTGLIDKTGSRRGAALYKLV